MRNKILFLGLLFACDIFSISDEAVRENLAYHDNLKKIGSQVKVCLKLVKSGYPFTDRDKLAVQDTFRFYLNLLAGYHDSLEKNKKESAAKK